VLPHGDLGFLAESRASFAKEFIRFERLCGCVPFALVSPLWNPLLITGSNRVRCTLFWSQAKGKARGPFRLTVFGTCRLAKSGAGSAKEL
jgi:hypothetical protein